MDKHAVHTITEALGAERICAEIGVKPRSIRFARTEGVFPARWYGPLKGLCDEAGIECPMSAFNWASSDGAL